ncbi:MULTISPECIES: terminase [unclassified Corynebacterium]|uniref:terminase n=1 Tax=unclassified Corynebacterium TaxID=2624378 RepID=UPI001FEE3C67|nr:MULTISPECIES: terminase [unclassified Corynebacterium]
MMNLIERSPSSPSDFASAWADLDVKPRFITEWPDPKAGAGSKIIKTMHLLGRKPMPWQRLAACVIGARREDGRPRWPFIVITVPRQSGKTTLCNAVQFHRAVSLPGAKVWYTCDTGQKARQKWLELVDDVAASPFHAPFVKVLKTNGSEAIKIPSLRSQIRPHPPTEDSLHSEQSDMNIIDEAWSFDEPEAAALMQAITPTQATRPHRQTIIISTMGSAESTWFHGLVDQGLAGDAGIFLLDYGIPFDADPTDLDGVALHHPAYGHTVDDDAIEAAFAQLGAAGFARAYGNLRTGARDTLIPAQSWALAQTTDDMPEDVEAFIGAAIDLERTETAVAAAAWVDGKPFIEILDVRPGTTWALGKLRDYHASAKTPPVIDNVGPSSTLFAEAKRAGLKPITPTVRELTTATAEVYDRLTFTTPDGAPAPNIFVRSDPALDLAMQIVDRRHLGDSWTWSRKESHGSIAALEAATLALHGLLTHKKSAKPFII